MAHRRRFLVLAWIGMIVLALPQVTLADTGPQLVPGTAVLLSNTGSGGGGTGGTTGSTSNATNIFAPASYVDYHQVGGEPTTVVDRYPFTGPFSCQVASGVTDSETGCAQAAQCSQTATVSNPCYPDFVYVSNPLGLGEFSQFYTSYDHGQTFRVPPHNPYFESSPLGTSGGGGGDSHQAVGQTTHSIFFIDLSGLCVTMNISRDLGQTFTSNRLGCEASPGVIDDRQWVAADETGGLQNVYMNFNNDTGCIAASTPETGCSIVFVKSVDDGGANTPADFDASPCNAFSMTALPSATSDSTPTACPDPSDPNLWIAGAVVVDTSPSSKDWHSLYIPFERFDGTNFSLWVAISRDQGDTWTRHEVALIGPHDPANIFPEMTIDTAGNLYYTWSQAQGLNQSQPDTEGETDVYYTYSQGGGLEGTWATPIDITKETGDSAIFPWMVAGSPGQVDLVMYKANTGLNPNIAFTDTSGNPDDSCTAPSATCIGNTTAWNTYFGQSLNALNSGANFKLAQISDHPIHIGGVCTQGIACQSNQYQNRDLLDFLTVDVDHTGAAYTTWADDNNSQQETRQFFSRQLAGASIFQGQTIAAMNTYPITDHAVTDPAGDVTDAAGLPNGSCPGMDLLGTSEKQSNGAVTITLTLNAPPTATEAIACSKEPATATGGLWGAEFWASSAPGASGGLPNGNFYVAYRDNPPDGAPRVEAGQVSKISPALNHYEFSPQEVGTTGTTLGGTCTSAGAVNPAAVGPCTLVLTAPLTGLGIRPGAGMYSISGFSTYYFGTATTIPDTNVSLGNTNLADIATPFDDDGTGTTG